MSAHRDYDASSNNASPRVEGTPSRSNENSRIDWLLAAVTRLEVSHEKLSDRIDNRFECFEVKIEAQQQTVGAHIDSRHHTTEERINNNHQLLNAKMETMQSKMETMESKIHKAIADSRIESVKWAIGLAVGFPSLAWMVIQIVKAITTK
ncbi:hypothetical protein [Citrobacter braakii]|uniref:hypothetical protein n=1 Tax=Citrobacter braakii TaxID=57706 RepID=UPI00403A3179